MSSSSEATTSTLSRLILGIVASAGTLLALLVPLSFLMMLVEGDSTPLTEKLSLAVTAVLWFAVILVPVAFIICALLFGGAYVFLRKIGRLKPAAFPAIGACAVAALVVLDSTPPFGWMDTVLGIAMVGAGALTGHVFSRITVPATTAHTRRVTR